MSKWYSFKELKRARTPMLLDSETGLPDNHVITVVERVISVDDSELIQNNVRTDTITLNLDAEYDGLNVIVIFTKPNNINVQVAYNGQPVHIPGSVMELTGSVAVSVVGLDAEGETRAVTKAAPDTFQVVASGAYTGKISQDDVDLLGQILQAVSDAGTAITAAETATAAATNATSQATSAATSANQAASSANSAASSANSAATKANSAAVDAQNAYDTLAPYMATIDSCANVLHREVGPDTVVTADDSFPCKPVEMTVYGNTVQNLWDTPDDAFNAPGISISKNVDGSDKIVASNPTTVAYGEHVAYILKPNTTYTISLLGTLPEGIGLYLYEYNSIKVQRNSGSQTFTTGSGFSLYRMRYEVTAGTTATVDNFRVMLNEGSEAQPWCPPGLNSVGDDGSVEIVTAGKNLWVNPSGETKNGITYTVNSDGSVTISGTSTAPTDFQIAKIDLAPEETYVLSIDKMVPGLKSQGFYFFDKTSGDTHYLQIDGHASKTVTTATGHEYTLGFYLRTAGVSVSGTYHVQLEVGSEATEWAPPDAYSATPIDLQGHTLNALPDGTRDELHIDGGGNVVLEKRVACDKLTANSFTSANTEYAEVSTSKHYAGGVTFDGSMQMNDIAVVKNADNSIIPGFGTYSISPTGSSSHRIGAGGEFENAAATLSAIKSLIGSKTITALYKMSTPEVISLGNITPPTMAAPNVTAYVAGGTPAEMTLDYVRDVNIVHSRLEERVAALELASATS